jgi:hypothetical protein
MTLRRGFALLFFVTLLGLATVVHAAKRWSLTGWTVELAVEEDGALTVHERLDYLFEGDTFTRAWREIPTDRLRSLTGLSVTSPDVEILEEDHEPSRRKQLLRWTFAPRLGPTTFDLRYRAEGAFQVDGEENLLRWTAVGAQVGAPIDAVWVRLFLPASLGLQPADVTALPARESRVESSAEGLEITWLHEDLPAETPYTVVLRMPRRFAAAPPLPSDPVWPEVVAALAAALVGLLPGLSLLRAWRGGRHEISPAQRRSLAAPEFPLLEAAVLAASATRSAEKGFVATLFDLANRGHLRLERVKGQGLFAGKQVKVHVLAPENDRLGDLERAFLDEIRSCDHLGAFGQKKWRWRRNVVRKIQRRHEAQGLFERHPGRSWGMLLTGVLLVAGGVALGAGLGGWAWAGGAFAMGLGLGLALTVARDRVPTERGARLQAEIRAHATARRERVEELRRMDPVAAAEHYVAELGWLSLDPKVDRGWVKKLQESLKDRTGAIHLPGWAVDRVEDEILKHGAAYGAFLAYTHVSTAASGGVAPSAGAAGATGAGAGAGGGAGGGGAGAG